MKRFLTLFLLLLLPLQVIAAAMECYGSHAVAHLADGAVSMQAGDGNDADAQLGHNACGTCQLSSMSMLRTEVDAWPVRIFATFPIAFPGDRFSSAEVELHDPPPRASSR